jgi:predicted CxxxxCH...CXXCH cytochrome family protein
MSTSLVLDNQSIYGSGTAAVSVTTFTGANDKVVCAECHDTGNVATLSTKTHGAAYRGKVVEGLYPVDPFNSTPTASLHVSAGVTDNMIAPAGRNCLGSSGGCHASPHNPVGESSGGQNCSVCHSGTYAAMDNGSNTGYHHVMMSDAAPSGANYPTTQQPTGTASTRTCTICHVDHNYFSKLVDPLHLRAKNLRADITLQPDNSLPQQLPRQADFDNTQTRGGICTSCHELTQTKNSGNIKADGTTTTPVVSLSYFNPGAHNYGSSSPYVQGHFASDNADANSYFRSNCTKCHNDTLGTSFQDNTTFFQFALHASTDPSAVNKLLAPLGFSPLTDNLSENFCYRCHSHLADAIPGTRKKTVDGRDWYNNVNMSAASENVWGVINGGSTVSRHPVSATWQKGGTAVVDCLNCHNVHLARSATGSIVSYPDNTYAFDNYVLTDNSQAGKQNRARYCLRCHDGAPPAYVVSATSYVPLTVRADNASMNQALWGGLPDNTTNRGHWNVRGQFLGASIVSCDACHDKHGSTIPKLLETTIAAQAVTGNNNTVCQACHTAAGYGYPAQEAQRTAGDNGYFNPTPVALTTTTARWPGFTVWGNATYSPHGTTGATFGGFDGISRGVSDCRTCHDVHGTANAYNLLKGTHTATNFGLCFQCHGKTTTATDNISRYFPVASGGDNANLVSTTNVGHNVKTAGGYLAAGSALPCYDCHMTHGSSTNNTQLKSDQRWTGLGNTKYGATPSDNAADNASRVFCLGCHVASDDAATTGLVENLQRQTAGTNKLKLPTANAIEEHKSAWLGQGCQRCHYGTRYTDNTYGPHYPATGLCDTCHESQGARSAAAATWNGAHQTHTDNTQYGFACKQCHSWTATVSKAAHKNDNAATQHAEVRFDNQATAAWDNTIRYATPFAYEYRSIYNNPYTAAAAVPTYVPVGDNAIADARQASVRWTDGTCGTVWCHSNANPLLVAQGALNVSNQYQSATWRNNWLRADCTGCHGGDAASTYRIGDNTAPTNGSIVHLKHVNGGAGCYKCHYNTVKTANNRVIDNLASHVNASKDVVFAPVVGGAWNNGTKSCSGTSCHGTPAPLPEWDNLATVTGCAVCHQSNGPGNTFTFTPPHQTHTDNQTYKTACEACHANFAGGAGPNAIHADGDNAVGAPRTVQVAFTDCAANQTYNSRSYYSTNLKSNPYPPALPNPTPLYTENAAFVGGDNDAINPATSWSRGTCNSVWCHSNANPLLGSNAYRSPQWTGTLGCTPCHGGASASGSMVAADNLSRVHVQHAATNLYGFTCDECHARTVSNDCTVTINGATGYDNHVNGIKSVFFSATLRTTNINQGGGTYDNAVGNYRCNNTYCHSNGTDNTTFNTAAQWPMDNTVGWDNAPTATCRSCHAGDRTASPTIATQAHDNHVNNAATIGQGYACNRCHNATVAADNVTIASYALHVNGYKNVSFPTPADNGSYVNASKTCTTYCHRQGNRTMTGGADNMTITWDCTVDTGCKTCHGSKAVSAGYSVASNLGEPNYDNGAFGATSQNSHARHVSGTDNTTVCQKCHPSANPTTLNVLATDNWARHINDNVDVARGNGVSFTWTQGTHTCSNISCHNGGTAQWGAALNCYDCHTGTGDLDDFGTGGNPATMSNNNRTARIDNTEWTTRGHGRTAGTYGVTLHPAANFAGVGQCVYCHDSVMEHDNTTNPFRLANNNIYGNGWNDVCMVCHRKTPAPSGYDPDGGGSIPSRNSASARVDNNHYGTKHTTTYNGGKFCYDCHDPHGDNNIFMVARMVSSATDNVYGLPLRSSIDDNTNRKAAAFADNTTGANYADNVTRLGICQVCHTTGVVNHWTNTAPWSDGHNASTKCTTCHLHDAAFKGLGGPDVGQYFDRVAFANYPDNSSHPLRGLTTGDTTLRFVANGSENCLGCHYGSGSGKTSDECLMCHFENVGSGGTPGALDGARHMDQQLQLATITGNALPTTAYTIASIQNFDDWCLQCHQGTVVTLGGRAPSAASKTVIDPAAFTNGRHRAVVPPDGPIGCIYCHQPHGRSNSKLVRENPANRRTAAAGPTPARFNVYPNDNLGLGGYGTGQNVPFRSRPYWGDNTLPYVPEADDDQSFCNAACHAGTFSQRKDRIVKRVEATGNYVTTGAPSFKKIYLVNGIEYTNDNSLPAHHQHPDGEIIPTDNMVYDYAQLIGLTGPGYYQYPFTGSSYPTAYNPALSDLPFSYDFADGTRDFTNAYNGLGVRIAYRFTCSTCHNPHGTALANAPGVSVGYPDLRLQKMSPSTLCNRCHK